MWQRSAAERTANKKCGEVGVSCRKSDEKVKIILIQVFLTLMRFVRALRMSPGSSACQLTR